MDSKKYKKMFVAIALVAALLMFGTGMKKAEAANIDQAAFYAIISGFYLGAGQGTSALAFYYENYDAFYDAYLYYDTAAGQAANSAVYASYSSAYYAYNAYVYALDAYSYLDAARNYAYIAWYYYSGYDGDLAMFNGGLAAQSLAYAQYYAAYLY